jgi:hypothetical protein
MVPGPQPAIIEIKESADVNVLSRREKVPGGKRVLRGMPEPAADAPASPLPATPPSLRPTPPSVPNESGLWALLRQERYAEVLSAVEQARMRFPAWQPPTDLLTLARTGERRLRLDALVAAGDGAALLAVYRADPPVMACDHLPAARLAASLLSVEQPEEAVALARRLLQCPGSEDSLGTLEQLRSSFPASTLIEWIEDALARDRLHTERLQRLRYEVRVESLLAAERNGNAQEAASRFSALAGEVLSYRDAGTALSGAWAAFRAKDCATAGAWFRNVLEWNPMQHDARVGAALCAIGDARYDNAIELARLLPEDHKDRTGLLRDALVGKTQAAYGARRHAEVSPLLAEAAQYGPLPRYARAMEAWSRLQLGDLDAAAKEFAALYRETPDAESAEGVFAALTRLQRDGELNDLAATEPLASKIRGYRADQAFAAKRFLAAQQLDADRFADTGGIGAPRATFISAYRQKTGTPGTSQLAIDLRPGVEAAWGNPRSGDWRVRFDRIVLGSGTWDGTGRIGTAGVTLTNPLTNHVDGWQPSIAWRNDEGAAWEAELGTTPGSAPVAATASGLVARNWTTSSSRTRLELHRQPVRESILSYTGMRDPYGGGAWGRVARDGVLIQHRQTLVGRWTASLKAQIEELSGRHVATNRRAALDATLGYALPIPDFDYAVMSLGASTDHYRDNLSQFTMGHGGYFSPQRYWRIGPSFDFTTAENRPFMLRGRVAIGRTGKQENDAPVFPLADDGQRYPGSSGTGSARDMEIGGAWQVNRRIQAGGWISLRHSIQYDDRAAMFFVRFLFDSRRSILSSDLPNSYGARLF